MRNAEPKRMHIKGVSHTSYSRGFSLIEVLIGTAVFVMIATAGYSLFASIFKMAVATQASTLAVQLADEQFEIIRNMPYTSVGLTNGIPLGILPQTQTLTRGGFAFTVGLTVRNINLSTSTVQASDKLVEVNVSCTTCQNFNPVTLTGQISPASLQSASVGGALVVKAFDANGQPVEDANVNVQSVSTSTVVDNDVTNNDGVLNIIGVPQGVDAYQIIVSKTGYSTDRTYAAGGSNPTPTNPNKTVLTGQISQVSFAIDRLSTLNISSVSPLCVPAGNFHMNMVGAKQIGASLPKYSQSLVTNGSGLLSLGSMEWDSYTITPTDSAYDVAGINPFSPFSLNPNNTQNVQIIVVPKNANSLMVSVMDNATKLPISGATVQLTKSGFDQTQIAGQGYFLQTDWSHGATQDGPYTDPKAYATGSGVDTTTASSTGSILLHWNSAATPYTVNSTSTLESSTFDTGTSSNFYTISWKPASQPPLAGSSSVKFQFAAKPTSTSTFSTTDYLGPDGTHNTYFTVPGGSINAASNNNEFARYMAYLNTTSTTTTPSVTEMTFAYTSGCIPPGQILFQGLTTGTYTLTVTQSGYVTYSGSVTVSSGWQEKVVKLTH